MQKVLKKALKIFQWTLGITITFFILLLLLIQIPYVQNLAKEKTVKYLEDKIQTKVSVDTLEIDFPKTIILKGVYFKDQKQDTLLAAKKLAIEISFLELMNNTLEINAIDFQAVTLNLSRNSAAVFNFDYIVKAFSSPIDTSKTPMVISLDKINLDQTKVTFADAISKTHLSLNLNHVDTRIKTFDLEKMDFEVPKVTIKGLELNLKQGISKNLAEPDNTPATIYNFQLGEIDLSKANIDYQDEKTKLTTSLSLKKLDIKFDKTDLYNRFILIDNIALSRGNGKLEFGKLQKIKNELIPSEPNNWEIKIRESNIKRVDFAYDDQNENRIQNGIDYNHIKLSLTRFNAENLRYSPVGLSVKINSLQLKEQSGLDIQSLKTEFFFGKNNAFLKNLYLKTPQTVIKDELLFGYTSIETLSKDYGQLSINASLQQSEIGFKDILLFMPQLSNKKPFTSNPNAILKINSKIYGTLNDLTIPKFEVSGMDRTKIVSSGTIKGLPDINKAYFDLNIKNFESTASVISKFAPKETIPNSIQIPDSFKVNGNFKGTIHNFSTDLVMNSSLGQAKINAKFDQSRKNNEKYDAKAEVENFDLGKLIKNKAIGKISLKATIKGTGLDLKTANSSINGTIFKINYNKYSYQDLELAGTIKKGLFTAVTKSTDPNLTFDLISSGSFKDKYPAGKVKLNIDIADLDKLNLHAGPLKIRAAVDADIQSADLDYLNAKFNITNLTIADAKEQFVMDSINLIATSDADKNTLLLKSQVLNAELNGKYKLTEIATALSNTLSNYYETNSSSKKSATKKQQLEFKIRITDNPILLKLIPEVKSIEPISIAGSYNSVNDSISFHAAIPKVVYGENTFTNALLDVDTQKNALVYNVSVDDIQNKLIQLPFTTISGKIQDNIADYSLLVKDIKDKERYQIAGTLKGSIGNNEISIDPKKLLLNYESWKIASNNLLRFGNKGIYADNFELSKQDSKISVQSESESPNAPIAVDFKNFKIETISSMFEKSDLQLSGNSNGTVLVKNANQSPIFTSNLTIDTFTFKKDTIGTINIKVDNIVANTYTTKIAITEQDNQLNLDGTYKAENGALDMNLAIAKLHLKSIQGFTMDELKESSGFFSGTFKISGNTDQPKVSGDLQFNEVGFKVTRLNSVFKSINDKIYFTNDAISFDRFVINDEKDNDLVINGNIDSHNFNNFGFDLALDAVNFKALNSNELDNDLYYGEIYLDNHLKIGGDLNNPTVNGSIKVNKDTKLTIVLPQSDPSIADREGIVEFIDQDNPSIVEKVTVDESLSMTEISGINASVNIEVDKEAELSIVIDKANGDFLKLKGEAQLTGGIDPSGKTTLTGRYELKEGSYEMNFNMIKRKFDIKSGSYILWTGEPTTADINITAVYKNEAAPLDLVGDQLGSVTASVRNTYKQKIPFETELKMEGELMKPSISFDIILPDGNNSVSMEIINTTQAKLAQLRQQPDELNKQVFALLLLNRFIGENPFASESAGSSVSSIARESASKILSQQLNNLAADLISGVELNFDLQSSQDYTTGQLENKTDLNVGISKKLLNDRLKVTVGSSFGLEGPEQKNQEASSIAGDVSVEYQLSKDGRYKVRAYRLNKYQVALQGQVIETGIAFVITLDYNKFKELFQSNKTTKEKDKLK
ncbi:translocation/assembly module TamB domain-containing protein [Flavobacterium sp. W22_SRS_FP1]|uniref:translocation/assembly module TamB domain-containing protein n=1 Tax=Flavobacterium sp. W22_SRS_FP1 TaxID=3240276 RepID=UPI003F90548A